METCKFLQMCTSQAKTWLVQVDHTYEVKGVGSVVSGTVVAGTICLGQHLLLGPSLTGTFESVCVSGIQRAQVLPISISCKISFSCNHLGTTQDVLPF